MYEPECFEIADNIERILHEKGIGVHEMAVDAGVSNSGIYRFLSGNGTPTLDTLVKIAKALNVHIQDIIGDVSMDWRLE